MSQGFSDRNVVSRRRARRPAAPVPAAPAAEDLPIPWRSLVVFAVLLALVVAGGLGLDRALQVQPSGVFAKCKPAARLGPHTFAGPPAMCINTKKIYLAKVNTTAGEIDISMNGADAPTTINNFVVLAVNGYYNGLTFQRVEGWVAQGGDPQGDGRGGPGYTLPAETNAVPWALGSVGMARNPDGTINGSQFFILKSNWPGAGPGDTAFNHFGTVLGGTSVLPSLKAGDRITSVIVSVQ